MFTEFHRGIAGMFFKGFGKNGNGGKSALIADLPDGLTGFPQQTHGFIHPVHSYIFGKTDPDLLMEYMGKMTAADSHLICQDLQRKFIVQILIDVE